MEVKGAALAALPMFIKHRFSEAGYHSWLEALDDGQRDVLGRTVLVQNWYPVDKFFLKPTELMCSMFYEGDMEGAWESGRFSADFGLTKMFKVFMKFGTPSFMLKRSSTLLQLYYRPSTLKVVESSRTSATLRITRFEAAHQIFDHRIGGWMERALELHGCIDPVVELTHTMTNGSEFTQYEMTWK